MRRLSFIITSMWLAILAGGCSVSPPRGAAATDMQRDVQASHLPGPGDSGPGRFQRLPQLRLDSDWSGRSRQPDQQTGRRGAASASRAGQTPAEPAANPGFVLGEGDVIKFSMFGQPDMTSNLDLSSRGRVSLPLVDSVDIGGMTPAQAERRIASAYSEGGYFKDPQVNITVAQYRSSQISVLGEVNKPGRYPLKTRTTVLDALALAQGEKPTGSRQITIIHKTDSGSRYRRVNADALVSGQRGGQPIQLGAGDIVYVPKAAQFYIYGEVQKPDAYAIRPGMTVMQAIAIGGGLTPNGSDSRVQIRRRTDGGTRELSPQLDDDVKPGDVIFVKERFF